MTQTGPTRDDGTSAAANAELLYAALAAQKAGQPDEAAAICRQILARAPDQPHALMLLGLILGRHGDAEEAATLLSRYLERAPNDAFAAYSLGMVRQRQGAHAAALALFDRALAGNPDLGQAFHGRGVSLHELERLDEAAAAFEHAVTLEPSDPTLRNNYGSLLRSQERLNQALAEFDRAVALDPALAIAHCNRGVVLTALKRPQDGIVALRAALALDPDHVRAHHELAEAYEATWQDAEAQHHRIEAIRRRPMFVESCLGDAPLARVLILCSAGRSDVATRYLVDRQRFTRIHVFMLGADEVTPTERAYLDRVPPFDVVFNSIADPDRGAVYLREAAAFVGRHDRPVLNPPERIAITRRDRLAECLSDIPGLLLPQTRRLGRDDLARLATSDAPGPAQVVRPVGSHGGEGLRRIERPGELAGYLGEIPFSAHYLTDYCDFRSPDGWFRKYRFVFVDRDVYPYHLAISREWKVHYWRVDMNEAPWMKREEEAFLADYRSIFPGELGEAIRTVARRLDLDYAGMDCGLMPDGRLVLFEANANMLVHLYESRESYPYKHAYVPRIFEAAARMIEHRRGG